MQIRSISAYFLRQSLGACWMAAASVGAMATAQAQSVEPVRNVVQLSATGQVEVNQDWLQMNLAVSREGRDAAAVQKQLQQVVDAALQKLKPQAQGQALQVRSGSFGVSPRQNDEGKITGWGGSAEIILEGKDFAGISQAASGVEGMTVAGLGFGLSKEGSEKVQEQAQTLAIDNFKSRASQLTKSFGFNSYSLREVSVNSQDNYPGPRVQRTAQSASMVSKSYAKPVPVEAGKAQVTVNVSGSVQLQ